MNRFIAIVFCGLTAACSMTHGNYPVPSDQPPAEVGRIERTPRMQIPFPPGEWVELLRNNNLKFNKMTPGYASDVKGNRVTYGLLENGNLKAIYEITYNTNTDGYGFGVSTHCVQENVFGKKIYASNMSGGSANSFDCYVAWPAKYDPPRRSASDYYVDFYEAARKFGGLPTQGVVLEIVAGYAQNSVDVVMVRFPERDGIVGGNWESGQEGPRERAYISDLLNWAQRFRGHVVRGTKGQL